MTRIGGATNSGQQIPSKRRRSWEIRRSLPQTAGQQDQIHHSPSAISDKHFVMDKASPEKEIQLYASYASSESVFPLGTRGSPTRVLFHDRKNHDDEIIPAMDQQNDSSDHHPKGRSHPKPKVPLLSDNHDSMGYDCRGTVIVTAKTRPTTQRNVHFLSHGSCDSQDSSCSQTTLSSLGSSAVYSPCRALPSNHAGRVSLQQSSMATQSRFKIKHSTARLILWAWTIIGILITSSITIYQSAFLGDFLQSQGRSFSPRVNARREYVNLRSHQSPKSLRLTNLAGVSSIAVALPSSGDIAHNKKQPADHAKKLASLSKNEESATTEKNEAANSLYNVVQPPPHVPGLAQHAEKARQVSSKLRTKRWLDAIGKDSNSNESHRVVFIDGSGPATGPFVKTQNRMVQIYPADYTDKTQLYGMLDSNDERIQGMEPRKPLDDGECIPMKDWQTHFYPSCNEIHSLGLEKLGDVTSPNDFDLFGTKGYWRNAWKVDALANGQVDTVVLKTLKIKHNFEEAHFEHDRIDAVAMERLTSSAHVINIFGFCGHSVVTEYADGKRLGTLADKSKKIPLERLRIARDISQGLADVHGIDGDDVPATFVHLDINPANVVSIQGTLKLNDFNIGILRQWNTTTNEPCGFPAQYPNPQWRSPEEARNDSNLTEKVDLFSLGHIFFRLICGHEPWNKLEPGGKPSKASVTRAVQQGLLPTIPDSVMTSTDQEIVAIRNAMLSCYTNDPKRRPSAREVAIRLQSELDRLESNSQSNTS